MYELLGAAVFEAFLSSQGYLIGSERNFDKEIYRTGTELAFCGQYAFKFLPRHIPIEEKRRQFEIEVAHQRLFNDDRRIVLGYFPVVVSEGQPIIVRAAESGIVDYVLLMRRIANEDAFLARLASGNLQSDFVADLAATLSEFHDRCEVATVNEKIAHVVENELSREVRDLSEGLRLVPFLTHSLGIEPASTLELLSRLGAFFNQTKESRRSLFWTRGKAGCIRDIHGDLHAENWWIFAGKVALPDVMPLDRYRIVDILRDVARVSLELRYHGRPDLASHFLVGYRQYKPNKFSDELIAYFAIRLAVGDLTTQLDHFNARSTAYVAERLRRPVMLLPELFKQIPSH